MASNAILRLRPTLPQAGLGAMWTRFCPSYGYTYQQTALKATCSSVHVNIASRKPARKEYPKPYKPLDTPVNYGKVNTKIFDGGLLPRIDKEFITLPQYKPNDPWSAKKAILGQNDYIDILGDGSVQPYQTIQAPAWLRGYRGNEYERTLRRLKFTGKLLHSTRPNTAHNLQKRMRYLFQQFNRRRKSHRKISRDV